LTSSVSGWLFDAYPLNDKMVFWVKQEGKNSATTVRLEDYSWTHSIYAASEDKTSLNSILYTKDKRLSNLFKHCEFKSHYEKITDVERSDVLKLALIDPTKAVILARMIESIYGHGKVRLYNVDLLPAQSYFYEHDVFPLAYCKVVVASNDSGLRWYVNDSVGSTNYKIPNFKTIHLKISTKQEGGRRSIPQCTDKIGSIVITISGRDSETIEIQNESEVDMINDLTKEVGKFDPDFILTDNGDSFDLPYLTYRAEENGVIKNLILGRESSIPLKRPAKEGTSYFSYGKIYFKPTPVKLLGRIHIDINNSFIYNDSGLEGLYEIARICRMPLHTAARA